MRVLKFRAWDKLQNKFLYPYPEGFSILGETICFDLIGQQLKEFTPERTTIDRLNDVIIMQYTGLKDKNDKEIYEGDIIQEPNSLKWGVYYYENSASFRIKNGDMSSRLDISFIREMEIIGNIYENPELIKND